MIGRLSRRERWLVEPEPKLCRECGERPCAPRYLVCQRCRHGAPVPCPTCDGLKRPASKTCVNCFREQNWGPNHAAWKGGRTIDTDGYVRVWTPDDPRANCDRYM